MAAAAEEHADRVRAAHQAKQVKADQQAALALQRKREQAADLKKRGQMVALRNEEVHHKRFVANLQNSQAFFCLTHGQQQTHELCVTCLLTGSALFGKILQYG